MLFRPLLAGVGDEAGIEQEVFFVKGSDHDAYVHIRAILQTAKADLFLIDPYMDGSSYLLLGTLAAATMTIRILTSKCPDRFCTRSEEVYDSNTPAFTVERSRNKGLSRPLHHS